MSKLIGMMSWYDEAPSWLSGAIASHARAGMTHLVAVDGAYALFPGGKHRSGFEQHRAISETCEGLGIGCTIHVPQTVWLNNEIDKRSFMFRLALTVSDGPQDWLIVIDADHLMTDPDDLPKALADTDLHVAEITAYSRLDPTVPEARQFVMPRIHQQKIRLLYRANPGLHCEGNHYTYVDGEGRVLWGQRDCVPALDLAHVKIEHRSTERDMQRRSDQRRYYTSREANHAERGPGATCDWIGCHNDAEGTVPYQFEQVPGSEALQAGGISVCAKHAKRAHYENRVRLAKLGIDYGREGELLKRHT